MIDSSAWAFLALTLYFLHEFADHDTKRIQDLLAAGTFGVLALIQILRVIIN